jgi:hypothetical protein
LEDVIVATVIAGKANVGVTNDNVSCFNVFHILTNFQNLAYCTYSKDGGQISVGVFQSTCGERETSRVIRMKPVDSVNLQVP